ncbi:MAG TPA: hypothetical protein PKA41_11960 [Verrucomicrobiota bacterium]|nr:hypothetical protein [Verrucomicrobiota bacterium]
MSFGKLLAAGKSVAGAGSVARYKADPRVFLPRFISPKNPFVRTTEKDVCVATVTPATSANRLTTQAADSGVRAATGVSFESVAARLPIAKKISSALLSLAALTAKLNPVKLLARRGPRVKAAIPRFGKPAVQAELSLDRVRVMRNDLSDADIEIVAAGRETQTKRSTQEGAWDRLATRVFGTETTP